MLNKTINISASKNKASKMNTATLKSLGDEEAATVQGHPQPEALKLSRSLQSISNIVLWSLRNTMRWKEGNWQ